MARILAGIVSNYSRGADFERQVIKILILKGYAAIRAAGSHSPADIWATRNGKLFFVQCKISGKLSPDEWNTFFDYATENGAIPIMASRPCRGAVAFHHLTGRKDKGKRTQPMEVTEL